MNREEIDKLVSETVSDPGKSRLIKRSKIYSVRKVLNIIFMIGFIAAIAIYFFMPESKTLFYSVGFGALAVKVAEYLLRFLF